MSKLTFVAVAAVLFFTAGLFAGHSLPRTGVQVTDRGNRFIPGSAADSTPAADPQISATVTAGANPLSFISSTAAMLMPEVASTELKEQTLDGQKNERPHDERRAAILKLIQRQFPDTDPEVAEVWADTFHAMPVDEVSFILEQKRRISTELGAAVTMPQNYTSPMLMTEPLNCTPEPSANIALRMVQLNLQSAYSLGFCRMVVFPEAVSDPDLLSANERYHLPATVFRCFESGRLIQSPVPTHVALTESDSTMFRLDGNRLTRRGDFRLLQNRRLGIVTRSEELASVESTPIPADATNIRISANGSIQFRNADGESCEAGHISVCSIADLAELESTDGVIFEASSAENLVLHDNAAGLLLTKTLEQSNVDLTCEKSLLAYLKSLSETSF